MPSTIAVLEHINAQLHEAERHHKAAKLISDNEGISIFERARAFAHSEYWNGKVIAYSNLRRFIETGEVVDRER